MLRAISLNMAVKKNSTKPVDPSNFLWGLRRKLSIIRGVPFNFNTQQDVTEILQGGQLVKNENFFSCTRSESNNDLTVTLTIEDEGSFTNKYSLVTTLIVAFGHLK